MPPKRQHQSEDESSDSSCDCAAAPLPVYQHPVTAHYATIYSALPTEAVLSQTVGVATRLSARIAALSYSTARGEARIYRDAIRIADIALTAIEYAVLDLAALELVLKQTLENLKDGQQNISPTPRRRPRK